MTHLSRRLAGVAAAAAAASTAACSSFLEVDNPSAVPVENLADSSRAGLLVAGVVGQFQTMVGITAMYSGVLADESRASHVNISFAPIDQRAISQLNDLIGGVYSPIQRLRYAADTTGDRIASFAAANGAGDLRVARMRAFAGYGYVYLGEMFCKAPINGGASETPEQLFQQALPRFDEAIAAARAAKTASGVTAAATATADSILNLALVGGARASLNLRDLEKARSYAAQVPATGFEYRAHFAEGNPPQPGLPVNPYYNAMGSPAQSSATTGNATDGFSYASGSLWLTVDSAFIGLRDPRVPMTSRRVSAMNATPQFVANKPRSFGGYVAPSTTAPAGAAMTPGASIRVASSIEAQYVIAEANAGSAATLTFVNAQRTANAQGVSTAATPAAILADLRDQKRREFYLDGRRLGEIRRYKAQYQIDFFPPSTAAQPSECFPLPLSEINSNPNAQRQ